MKSSALWQRALTALAIGTALLSVNARAQDTHPPHWAYDGKEGPKDWGKLDPAFASCSIGHAQSPVDVKGAKVEELPAIKFNYNAVPLNIIDNGHTIQVNYAPGSTITIGDKTYTLQQFHFHHPSENHVNDHGYDMEAHLVHSDANGHASRGCRPSERKERQTLSSIPSGRTYRLKKGRPPMSATYRST